VSQFLTFISLLIVVYTDTMLFIFPVVVIRYNVFLSVINSRYRYRLQLQLILSSCTQPVPVPIEPFCTGTGTNRPVFY
jgi:hypothetical protein